MEQESYKPRETYSTRSLYVYTLWAWSAQFLQAVVESTNTEICDMFFRGICVFPVFTSTSMSICCLFHSKGDIRISDSINLTVDSDINGKNPQFTLACISTGGPATNVTWTRDLDVVSGGKTMLNNTVTAQYTHTLTVTGRLPGQYQCTVSNNKPSTAKSNFTVQGGVTVL